jgi:menaquinol-cytochrome c reductase iron-sulfur subunit
MMEEKSRKIIGRRPFLGWITAAISSLIASAYTIPAVRFVLGSSLEQETEQWLTLGSISKVPLGTPTLFKINVERRAGWVTSTEDVSVYILTNNGRDYAAMSNICTHLGCRVRWVAEREQFFCPCHNGVFDKDGTVVSGPPPRPLDRYPVNVEADQISILAT